MAHGMEIFQFEISLTLSPIKHQNSKLVRDIGIWMHGYAWGAKDIHKIKIHIDGRSANAPVYKLIQEKFGKNLPPALCECRYFKYIIQLHSPKTVYYVLGILNK